jgi:thioredoxin reductase
VYIIHRRDDFRASKVMQKRALEHPKIEVLWSSVVESAYGNERGLLGGLKVKDLKSGEVRDLPCAGLFFAIGHEPATKFLDGQVRWRLRCAAAALLMLLQLQALRLLGPGPAGRQHAPAACSYPAQEPGPARPGLPPRSRPARPPPPPTTTTTDPHPPTHPEQVALDEDGYIATQPGSTETSVAGVYAAGDVQDKQWRQAITAAGSGCMAALQAEHFISAHEASA